METARVIALIGGLLILISLLVSFAIFYIASVGGLAIGPLVPLGFFIDFVCMIVLIFSENSLFLLIAGISGTISSFLLLGKHIRRNRGNTWNCRQRLDEQRSHF